MAETHFNKTSKHPNDTIVSGTQLTGQTVEIKEYGLVGYWLQKKDSEGTKAIFEGYYALRLKEYEKAHESDDDAWERDFKKEFTCRYHIPIEKKLIKASESLLANITESDQKRIISITDNYLKFVRAKRKELYPPNYPANKVLEETFFDAYRTGGPAYECMSWMRTEYNLPYMGPHWHKESKTEKERLSGKWKEHHERDLPEYVAEGYEDFDNRVLWYTNGGLMDEIDENIKKCETQEDRIRYVISLLQPFKEFAEAFYAKARIDERKRSIVENEKLIKGWETMPDDAVDERTGEPIQPKDQILACKKTIEKYRQDIEYWKKVENDFFWFAQHGLCAGHYRDYPQEVNDEMCEYLGGWWDCMIHFAHRLAALALTYGIKLMDVQEKCEVYLVWHLNFTDYVDNKYITSIEHARKLLDEIEANKPKDKVSSKAETTVDERSNEAVQKTESDFEHLKVWQDNPDLDYYLSESHWNYHVNQLLYTYLKTRYNGNEVGVYINLALLNGLESTKIDYNQTYGVMFNEAYYFCSFVLTTPVPETKINQLEKAAAELCHIELAAPIVSYNILVMTSFILCFANDQKNSVGKFLKYLSFHNSTHYFGDGFHHFEDYIKIGLHCTAAIMIDSRLQPGNLRPGYDYNSKDEYLRKTIPFYRDTAEKLEKRAKEVLEKTAQPTDTTDAPSEKSNNSRKRGRGKPLKVIPPPPKYMTLKYVTHVNKGLTENQRKRVHLLYEKWKTPEVKQSDGGWDWLDPSVTYKDFCDLFEGNDRCCNLKIKFGKTNVISIFFTRLLNYIPKGKNKLLIEHQTNQSAQQIMVEQFGAKAINNLKRLSETDINRIKESIYILDWTVSLPPMLGGGDTDYDLRDETLQRYSANIDLGIDYDADVEQAVKSGLLRKGKHT